MDSRHRQRSSRRRRRWRWRTRARPGLEKELAQVKAQNQDQSVELAKLRAALKTFEAGDEGSRTIRDSKIALKARLGAVEAQVLGQNATIQKLRSDLAAANARLARQAQHFTDEMRRLGAGTLPAASPSRQGP